MDVREEIKIFWEGPFSVNEILDNKIDGEKYEVKASDIGLYQVYGSHPLYGDGVLVYIGRTKNQKGFRARLRDRWVIEYGNDTENVQIYLGKIFSDEAKIAYKKEEQMIEESEVLLINAMKPAYNSSNIQSVKDELLEKKFIVHNFGDYRRLYPVLDSKYFWETYKNFIIIDELADTYRLDISDEDEYYGFVLGEQFNIKGDFTLWFGVEYKIWSELKIPYMIQIESEDKSIIKKMMKSNYFKKYSLADDDEDDMFYIELDGDFLHKSIEEIKVFFEDRVNEIIKKLN